MSFMITGVTGLLSLLLIHGTNWFPAHKHVADCKAVQREPSHPTNIPNGQTAVSKNTLSHSTAFIATFFSHLLSKWIVVRLDAGPHSIQASTAVEPPFEVSFPFDRLYMFYRLALLNSSGPPNIVPDPAFTYPPMSLINLNDLLTGYGPWHFV